jgi:transcription-repair coupling factor (superfamily II helicase)
VAELEVDRQEKNSVLESLNQGIPFSGMEFLVPYFYPSLGSIFSYLPSRTIIWQDEAAHVDAEAEKFEKLLWQRAAKVKEDGRLAPPVEELYLTMAEWQESLGAFAGALSESLEVVPSRAKSRESVVIKSYLNSDLHSEIAAPHRKEPSLAPLITRLKEWEEDRIFFITPTRGDANRLKELLAHYDFILPAFDESFPGLLETQGLSRLILVGDLTQGCRLPDDHLILLTASSDRTTTLCTWTTGWGFTGVSNS